MRLINFSSFVFAAILAVNICAWTTNACHFATEAEKNRISPRVEVMTSNVFSDGKQFTRSRRSVPFISAGLYNEGTPNGGKIYISTSTLKGRKWNRQQILLILQGKGGGTVFITAEPNDSNCVLGGPNAELIDWAKWAYIAHP